jgi:hypothetical protein
MFRRLRRAFLRANISLLPNNALVWRRACMQAAVSMETGSIACQKIRKHFDCQVKPRTHNASKSLNEAVIFGFEINYIFGR